MDTFVIFSCVFGLFALCMWGLLLYTKNTVGSNSPLKVVRVYQIQDWQYFTKLDTLLSCYAIYVSFFGLKVTATTEISPSENYPWLIYLILVLLPIILLGMGIFSLTLTWNHWKYTKGVVLTTNPELHELNLNFAGHQLILRDGDLEKIVVVSNASKLRFCYYTYYLTNGGHFSLSEKMPGIWVIQEYFKKVPVESRHDWYPYIGK